MHDFVTKLALLSKMLGSVWCAICPYSSRIITGSASKAEKVPNFTKPSFQKRALVNFQKIYISGISKASAFQWYASFVLSPPTPSNQPCRGPPFWRHTYHISITHTDESTGKTRPLNSVSVQQRTIFFHKRTMCIALENMLIRLLIRHRLGYFCTATAWVGADSALLLYREPKVVGRWAMRRWKELTETILKHS